MNEIVNMSGTFRVSETTFRFSRQAYNAIKPHKTVKCLKPSKKMQKHKAFTVI